MSKQNQSLSKKLKQERRRQFVHSFFSRWPVRIGFVIIVLIVLSALLAPVICPDDPYTNNLANYLQAPSAAHWFGTDALGRDVLTRCIYGGRISLLVGVVATGIAAVLGVALGLLAGYLGKLVDAVLMRVLDAMMCVPVIILALFLGNVLGKGVFNIMLCLGICMAPGYARMTRGQVLSVKQLDYVTAGTLSGATRLKNALKHVLPNCMAPNIVMMTMNLGAAILTEASLSFLGMGITPPTPSWGAMVSDGFKYIRQMPSLAIIPGIFIVVTVWSFNICGDALRDALDPKLRGTL